MFKQRILLIIFIMCAFCLKGFALDSVYKNTLKEIDVKKSSSNSYLINLLFYENYTEPLSIQKKEANRYSIILPETKISANNLNVIYETDKDKIKLNVTEHPYLDSSINNGYVKIIINTVNNASIKVASDVDLATPAEKVDKDSIEIIKKEEVKAQDLAKNNPQNEFELTPPPISQAPKAPPAPKDYIDIMMLISLVLFVFLLGARLLYKFIKNKRQQTAVSETQNDTAAGEKEKSELVKNNVSSKETFAQHLSDEPPSDTSEDDDEASNFFTPPDISSTHSNINKSETPSAGILSNVKLVKEEAPVKTQTAVSNPILISNTQVGKNIGFYLIEHDKSYAVLGYIEDEIYVVKTFPYIINPKLQLRLHEKQQNCAVYILRLDEYKALIKISKDEIKVLTEF